MVGYVVEFCGLPGAGKSTIAAALVARLRLGAVPTTEVMAPLGPVAGTGERLTRKVGRLVRMGTQRDAWGVARDVGLRSGQEDVRDRIARPVNLLLVRDAVARAGRRPGVSVLDQGPVQEWWSAALRADADRVLAWADADPAPRADLLVRVDVPDAVLLSRLGGRQGHQSRLERTDEVRQRAELHRGVELLDALCGQAARQVRLMRVDGCDPAAAAAVAEVIPSPA